MTQPSDRFVVCVNNEGFPASLELRKLYEVVPDEVAAGRGLVRIIDESGEDYPFPDTCFVPVDVPKSAEESLRQDQL